MLSRSFNARVILIDPRRHEPLRPGQLYRMTREVSAGGASSVTVEYLFDPTTDLSAWLNEMYRQGRPLIMTLIVSTGDLLSTTLTHVRVKNISVQGGMGGPMTCIAVLKEER